MSVPRDAICALAKVLAEQVVEEWVSESLEAEPENVDEGDMEHDSAQEAE